MMAKPPVKLKERPRSYGRSDLEVLRLREALETIAVAAEFHAQIGVSDGVMRYAHESTYRLARATLDHKGEI